MLNYQRVTINLEIVNFKDLGDAESDTDAKRLLEEPLDFHHIPQIPAAYILPKRLMFGDFGFSIILQHKNRWHMI